MRDHAVRIQFRPAIEEEFLNGVGFVAEAQNKVLVPLHTVKIHEMPKNWLVADRDHRLRDVVTVVPDAGSQAAAEENHFHVNTVPIKVPLDHASTTAAPSEPSSDSFEGALSLMIFNLYS